jgi:hypothetical protein
MACHILRWPGIATLLTGYPLLAHHTNESAHTGNLVALVFIAEHWVRRRALPDMQHAHILDAVRAFRYSTARRR